MADRMFIDLGNVESEKCEEIFSYSVEPFEEKMFAVRDRYTFDDCWSRDKVEMIGSVWVNPLKCDELVSSSVLHYHVLRNNQMLLLESSLTQTRIPGVMLTLDPKISAENSFLPVFQTNILKNNIFMIFGTSRWLNMVTYKCNKNNSVLGCLMENGVSGKRSERTFFHAGRTIRFIPGPNDCHFTKNLKMDVQRLSEDAHTLLVVDENRASIYTIKLGTVGIELLPLSTMNLDQHMSSITMGLHSLFPFLAKKSKVLAIHHLREGYFVTLNENSTLLFVAYNEAGKKIEAISLEDSTGSSLEYNRVAEAPSRQFFSFIKSHTFSNASYSIIFVYHNGRMMTFKQDPSGCYPLGNLLPPNKENNILIDCVVFPISQSQNLIEFALICVEETSSSESSHLVYHMALNKKKENYELQTIKISRPLNFHCLTSQYGHLSTTVLDVPPFFTSVEDIHTYFLHKVFVNSDIIHEAVLDAICEFKNSTTTRPESVTCFTLKATLVELVQHKLASSLADDGNATASTSIDFIEQTGLCYRAHKIWERLYVTIVASNRLYSQKHSATNPLAFYTPHYGGCVMVAYHPGVLRVLSPMTVFGPEKISTRRQPFNRNNIFDSPNFLGVPSNYIVFKNLNHINQTISRLIDSKSEVFKEYEKQSVDKQLIYFEDCVKYFKEMMPNNKTAESVINNFDDIHEDSHSKIMEMISKFVETFDSAFIEPSPSFLTNHDSTMTTHCAESNLLSKIVDAHVSFVSYYRFFLYAEFLMQYNSFLREKLKCDSPSFNETNSINETLVIKKLYQGFLFYGHIFKLCVDSLPQLEFSVPLTLTTSLHCENFKNALSTSSFNDYYTVFQTPAQIVCQNYSYELQFNGSNLDSVFNVFLNSSVAKWLYDKCYYYQTLFHCCCMLAIKFKISSSKASFVEDNEEIGSNHWEPICNLQLQYYIGMAHAKLKDYEAAFCFLKELLCSLIHTISNDINNEKTSQLHSNFFSSVLDSAIEGIINWNDSNYAHFDFVLKLINNALTFITSFLPDDCDKNLIPSQLDQESLLFNARPIFNKLCYAKFMCYVSMCQFEQALTNVSIFECSDQERYDYVAIVCRTLVSGESRVSLVDVEFGDYTPLAVDILCEIATSNQSSCNQVDYVSRQVVAFLSKIDQIQLAAGICLDAYNILADGCLLKKWSPDLTLLEGLSFYSRTLNELLATEKVKLPLLAAHEQQAIEFMVSELDVVPTMIVNKVEVETMVKFTNACVEMGKQLGDVHFLPNSYPILTPKDMVKIMVKHSLLELAFDYANDDQVLMQYVLNATALRILRSAEEDSNHLILLLQHKCYLLVGDAKDAQLLCNLIRVYMSQQIEPPKWLETTAAHANVGKLIQTYLLELRLDKAAQWCVYMMENIMNHNARHPSTTFDSYSHLVELTHARLVQLSNSTKDPNDAMPIDAILLRLNTTRASFSTFLTDANAKFFSSVNCS